MLFLPHRVVNGRVGTKGEVKPYATSWSQGSVDIEETDGVLVRTGVERREGGRDGHDDEQFDLVLKE